MENIYIYMNNENKHSPIIINRLKYKTLLDFGFKKQSRKFFKKIKNKSKNCYKTNELIKLQPRINFIKKLI